MLHFSEPTRLFDSLVLDGKDFRGEFEFFAFRACDDALAAR